MPGGLWKPPGLLHQSSNMSVNSSFQVTPSSSFQAPSRVRDVEQTLQIIGGSRSDVEATG